MAPRTPRRLVEASVGEGWMERRRESADGLYDKPGALGDGDDSEEG
jgi:hypothetical protein